jgi:hypothetical protein
MKERIIMIILLALLISSTSSSFQMVSAHKPLQVDGNNNNFATAQEIPNHRVSWAIYEQLSESDRIHYYKFVANKGERVYAQISIPKLEKFSNFAPSIAILGSDLTTSNLERGYSMREYAHETGDLPFSIPPAMRAIVVDYTGPIPSSEFYEPFTQTSYWERQEVIINSLPSDGTYYLAVFDGHPIQEVGKYTLAVGEVEDFSAFDFLTLLPSAWFQTKFFFEDYLSPTMAISLLVALLTLIGISVAKRVKARRIRSDEARKPLNHQ